MTTMSNLAAACAALLLTPTLAMAQEMGQGHAHITTRSDVRLSLESVPGTSAARLAALGRAMGGAMSQVRQCYEEAVAARPTVTGTLRIRVTVPERGAVTLDVVEDGPADAPLLTCVRRVLTRQDVASVERPAAAILVLEMHNTAAHGAAETARRAEEASEVAISVEEGRPTARGEGPGVVFVVRGAAGENEMVAEAHRVLRSQLAGMLDCRRRASRRGRSPAGRTTLRMSMTAGRAPTMEAGASTVADPDAPACLARALARPHRTPEAGPATLDVEVTFAAAD